MLTIPFSLVVKSIGPKTIDADGSLSFSHAQLRIDRATKPYQRSAMLAALCGVVGVLLVFVWALNLESRLPALRIAEQPPVGSIQKILDPGTYQADDPAIVRSGTWFTQTLGTTSTAVTSESMVTSTAGSKMTVYFYGTDLIMDSRIGPESGVVRVTVDGAPSSILPSDSQGSFVDLSGDQAEETSILLATGLAHRDHTVVISSSGSEDVAISGFTVLASTAFPWAFSVLYTGLGTLLFVLVRLNVLMISRNRGWLR